MIAVDLLILPTLSMVAILALGVSVILRLRPCRGY